MSNTLEPIPNTLGKLRTGLMDQGFDQGQAFQIVLDLIRRADFTEALLSQE